jgi:hypothetical protein
VAEQPAEPVTVPLGGEQHQENRTDGQRHPGDRGQRALTGQGHDEHRQEQRHREVLEDEHRQHGGGLAVGQPAQVAQQPGHDPGRGDPGDPRQRQRPLPGQAQQEPGHEARWCVEDEVDHAGRGVPAERAEELTGRELETEGEKQQDDADLGGRDQEGLRRRQRDDPAVAQGQRGDEDERDRGEAEPAGGQAEDRDAEEEQAEFEQQRGDVIHAGA